MSANTTNNEYGFRGTMIIAGYGSDKAWQIAMEAIRAETGAESDEVENFLNSVWGRHFADDVRDFIELFQYTLSDAVARTIRKWNRHHLSPRTRRELDIPTAMPYLSGIVYATNSTM